MLKFKNITIDSIETFKKYVIHENEFSCESSFINLLVWAEEYHNMYCECDGQLIIKSGIGEEESFRLPFGDDFDKGIRLIKNYSKKQYPYFWIQDGFRKTEFEHLFNQKYVVTEDRDSFDYIYLTENLATLKGKKYHSKRNHISSFSKNFDYSYKEITKENIDDIKKCADIWYNENMDRFDSHMKTEQKGVNTILDNMDLLSAKGGAIYVDNKPIAFTLGSEINHEVYDIHIEKALKEYDTAYTVINFEFAKRLENYKYINREDDLGLEGLRKAKLSYKPDILLKKYSCIPEENI